MLKTIVTALAVVLVPTLAFAQAAQTPPTDPQSKRQQESPAVNNSTVGPATANTPSPGAPEDKKPEPSITATSPAGANSNSENAKKGPLQPSN
jgi:hypothetical protein